MKIKLIICIILFLNISCSKDDANTNYKNKIIGKWSLVDDGSGTTISNTNNCSDNETIEFLNNNTSVSHYYSGDPCVFNNTLYNYELNGNIVTQNVYVGDEPYGYTYTNKATIEVLNETNLVLHYFYTSTEGDFPEWAIIKLTYIRID
jgi:hypothetical protein